MDAVEQDLYQQAKQATDLINQLVRENDALRRQVESLHQQLDAARTGGGGLGPDTARTWVEAMAQARPEKWARVRLGDGDWDFIEGHPSGGGLRALLSELLSVPSDDRIARISWDSHWQSLKRTDLVGAYPRRFRPQSDATWFLRQQGLDGLAATLEGLLKGVKPNSKAHALITAAFLLYREEAVRMLTNEPGEVLDRILEEQSQATAPSTANAWRTFAELINGPSVEQQRTRALRTLELEADATPDQVKAKYRELAKLCHPDAGGDAERFNQISQAYTLLTA